MKSVSLRELIRRVSDDVPERIERAKRRYNSMLREAMRRETGLLLNRQDKNNKWEAPETISVPVEIMPGLPAVIEDIVLEDDFWLVSTIARYRIHLEKMDQSLEHINRLISELKNDPRGKDALAGRESSVSVTEGLVKDLLERLKERDPVRRILEVDEDVLGVYRYHSPRSSQEGLLFFGDGCGTGKIELYWAVIGLVADMMGVSVEALAAVVLIHELAHGYSHLGMDIDGKRWSFKAFYETHKALKEGLAQYYTHMICLRLKEQMPEWFVAYDELLKRQSDTYRTHLAWVDAFTQEEVRIAMLQVRRKPEGLLEEFSDALVAAREKLRKAGRRDFLD